MLYNHCWQAIRSPSEHEADSWRRIQYKNFNFFLQWVSLNQTVLVTCAVCRKIAELRSPGSFLAKVSSWRRFQSCFCVLLKLDIECVKIAYNLWSSFEYSISRYPGQNVSEGNCLYCQHVVKWVVSSLLPHRVSQNYASR